MGYSVSFISVDFPLPETPVIQANMPKGILMETSCKLLPDAPSKCKYFPEPFLLLWGISMETLLLK